MEDTQETVDQEIDSVTDDAVWDVKKFGLIFKGAYSRMGYARVPDLLDAMERRTGMSASEGTISALFNGKRMPKSSTMFALMITMNMTMSEIREAVKPDYVNAFDRLMR